MNDPSSWRDDPVLRGRFHPDSADDLQVIVHDGGPRFTDAPPELMWVRVLERGAAAYEGAVLNEPHGLRTVALGSRILFVARPDAEHPFRVSEKYLAERESWSITPCDTCGFPELFDAPSDLIRVVFPNLPPDGQMDGFTSFCPLCGGVQVVESKGTQAATPRPRWQFWK